MRGDDERAYARNTDPSTSHEAAAVVEYKKLEDLVERILDGFKYGLIIDEVVEFARPHCADRPDLRSSLSPRTRPLLEQGRVFMGGKRRNQRGRNQVIWVHQKFWDEWKENDYFKFY